MESTSSPASPSGNPAPREPTKRRTPRLLDQVRLAIRIRHYSRRTEKVYILWVRQFILFHGKRHPAEMGVEEVQRFLTSLAVQRRLSASSQNQALSALLFLYNRTRRHSHLGGVSPEAFERASAVAT